MAAEISTLALRPGELAILADALALKAEQVARMRPRDFARYARLQDRVDAARGINWQAPRTPRITKGNR